MARLNPDSRLEVLTKDKRNPEQETLVRTLVEGPRGPGIEHEDGSLGGPFPAFLLSPAIGDRLQALGLVLQSSDGLPVRLRELVILVIVGRHRCMLEWRAHSGRAVAAGATEGDVAAIKAGRRPSVDEPTLLAIELTELLLDRNSLDTTLYERLVSVHGERGVFELTALVGYYEAVARFIEVFRLDDPWE